MNGAMFINTVVFNGFFDYVLRFFVCSSKWNDDDNE